MTSDQQTGEIFRILEVKKIWDRVPHNAFTDLIRHENLWYCAFREGENHVSDDGKFRVIRSADGETWQPVNGNIHQSLTWLSADGVKWEGPFACHIP